MKTLIENEVAYDYASQTWVKGMAAVKLNIEQLSDALVLLTGEKAAEYARMIGVRDVESAIRDTTVWLERCKALEATAPIGGLVRCGAPKLSKRIREFIEF